MSRLYNNSMPENKIKASDDISFKSLFVPLTTFKAVHIIVILGFVVFGNNLFNGFAWDDRSFILFNTDIHSFDPSKIIGPSRFNTGYYRAIPALYFSTLYAFFGTSAFFYHILQLLMHIVNALLVFIVFRRFFSLLISFILSLLFLIHPIQVESVSAISSSGIPMFFMLGAIALILSFKHTVGPVRLFLIMSLLFLSLITKETGILFFIVIFFYRLLFDRHKLLIFLFAETITFSLYVMLRFSVGVLISDTIAPIASLALHQRLMHIPAILWYYLKTFFIPLNLSVGQQWTFTNIDVSNFYLPSLFVFICSVFLVGMGSYVYKHHRPLKHQYNFFLLWLLAGLLLLLQIFPLDATVADRWFYFPIVGVLGLLGILIHFLVSRRNKTASFSIAFVCILLLSVLSIRTISRNADWKNTLTLYSHDRAIINNASIEYELANEYILLNDYDNAIIHLRNSIAKNPCDMNISRLGYLYELKGDFDLAIRYYKEAIKANKCYQSNRTLQSYSFKQLSQLLLKNNTPELAKTYIKIGLQEYPHDVELWAFLSVSEYKLRNYANALEAARKGKSLASDTDSRQIFDRLIIQIQTLK